MLAFLTVQLYRTDPSDPTDPSDKTRGESDMGYRNTIARMEPSSHVNNTLNKPYASTTLHHLDCRRRGIVHVRSLDRAVHPH